jgi:predicted Zn-ribbon and HTH transcriptional regulator
MADTNRAYISALEKAKVLELAGKTGLAINWLKRAQDRTSDPDELDHLRVWIARLQKLLERANAAEERNIEATLQRLSKFERDSRQAGKRIRVGGRRCPVCGFDGGHWPGCKTKRRGSKL